jgi:hypothetical protein
MNTPRYPYDVDATGMPWWRSASETAESQFQREISGLRAKCCAGDGPAIDEAVRLCRAYKQPPADWLADAVAKFIDRHMPDQERRLRHAFATHRERWEAVVELQERRHELMARNLETRKLCPDLTLDIETLDDCCAAVSEVLGNTDAWGSAETIRKSYQLIRAAGGERATLESFKAARRKNA